MVVVERSVRRPGAPEWGTSPGVGKLRPVEAAATKLLVGPVCAGVGLALQVVHSPTDGFSASVAVQPWVQFDVSGE